MYSLALPYLTTYLPLPYVLRLTLPYFTLSPLYTICEHDE